MSNKRIEELEKELQELRLKEAAKPRVLYCWARNEIPDLFIDFEDCEKNLNEMLACLDSREHHTIYKVKVQVIPLTPAEKGKIKEFNQVL